MKLTPYPSYEYLVSIGIISPGLSSSEDSTKEQAFKDGWNACYKTKIEHVDTDRQKKGGR